MNSPYSVIIFFQSQHIFAEKPLRVSQHNTRKILTIFNIVTDLGRKESLISYILSNPSH